MKLINKQTRAGLKHLNDFKFLLNTRINMDGIYKNIKKIRNAKHQMFLLM